jgi:hypothetical protein
MVTVVEDATTTVVAWNAALVWPCATVTLAGTVATLALLLLSATSAPAAGAAVLSATLPAEAVPAVTVPGFRLTLERVGAGAGLGVPPLPLLGALLPAKLPAVGGAPPQAIRNRSTRVMRKTKTERGTAGSVLKVTSGNCARAQWLALQQKMYASPTSGGQLEFQSAALAAGDLPSTVDGVAGNCYQTGRGITYDDDGACTGVRARASVVEVTFL